MKHPITGNAFFFYALCWLAVMAGHTALLVQGSGFTLQYSAIDTFSFYPLLAGFGLSYFYVVRYVGQEGKVRIQDVAIHFVGIVTIVTAITLTHDEVLGRLMNRPEYVNYLRYSVGWRIATGVLILAGLVLIYYLAIHNRLMKNQLAKQEALKEVLRQTEMEKLKFQINPHFIFNSLNSISALTMTSPDKAQEMVIKLSDFFRNALGTNQDETQTVREELAQIDLYLDIERIRFGDRLEISKQVEDKCGEYTLPAMILQPLFENAIKHGVYENLEGVEISTRIHCKEGMLHVTVANTYDPLQNGKGNSGTGIGLTNVRSRLELLYGIPDLVTIERTNNQYMIHLLIPQA